MSKSVAQKIIEEHIVAGQWAPGNEIGIRIDQTLTQDATGTMVYLQFESMGLASVATDLSVSYVDHNTIQDGYENADDHQYLKSIAAKYGILFSKAGNGICHQVHLERFAVPGKSLLGSDSHTPTCGGVGMLAIGAGGIDVTLALAGAPFFVDCPQIIRINLRGVLPAWSSAKDIILAVLQKLSTKGNTGCLVEYGGDGIAGLSVPDRATIANMGAELGVTTSLFPSDDVTRVFLAAQGRAEAWREILPDANAAYSKTLDFDLAQIMPMVAQPHSPDNVCAVKEIAGLPVDQVTIGSCTNSSFKDLMRVAAILKGHKVHPRVSLVLAPGSKQVLRMLADNGALSEFIAAGARILEPVCGFCIGNCHAPCSEGVSLRTTNRNFKGRSGTKSAEVFLVSPETAAVSALFGELTDPCASGLNAPPNVPIPAKFMLDDSMILPPHPPEKRHLVNIRRGPNIGAPLHLDPLPDSITSLVALKVGDKITTDDIMPAGARLKYRSNIPKYAEFVFEQTDPEFSRRCKGIQAQGISAAIVGGISYGQGSSREHAAICPRSLGVRLVLARSFERIHFANLINFGILPLILENERDYQSIAQGDELVLTGLHDVVRKLDQVKLINKTRGVDFVAALDISSRQRDILMAGGVLRYAGHGKEKGEKGA